jgi:WD40 repeat protein
MSSSSSPPEDKFLDAAQCWNLEQLYADFAAIKQKPLSSTERICLRGLLCGLDPKEIAVALHRQPQGLRVDLTRGLYRYVAAIAEKSVKNWRDVAVLLEGNGYKYLPDAAASSTSSSQTSSAFPSSAISPSQNSEDIPDMPISSKFRDWGDAPDVPIFFGRTHELEQLQQWIIGDSCRVVAILGMGGIGKTNLSLKLAQGVQDQFQFVVWRSLLNAPPLTTLLTDLIQFLSKQQEISLPSTFDAGISKLLHYLGSHRCLLILDNIETILQGGELAGQYRAGYEGYGQLFQQLGAVNHQSCLLLTSREKPREIDRLEGKTRPVRSLKLQGLDVENSKQIFTAMRDFATSEIEWQRLIEFYNGNPLALELVAKHIDAVFDGNITAFLEDGTPLFRDLHDLLGWHFERLSDAEQEIMYWLTINREPLTAIELKEDMLSSHAKSNVSTTLQSLQRRFPLESKGNCFTQQPAVMEYVTHRIIEWTYTEITTLNIQNFNRYAFVKAQAKDYIRESQLRIFVEPLLAKLQACFHSRTSIVNHLQNILFYLKSHFTNLPGYAGGNLINLLCHFKVDLTGYDLSHLAIWQADLSTTNLHGVNLTSADLTKSVFAETFGGISCVAFSPGGQQLATSDTAGEVQVWNVVNGQQQLTVRADAAWTWAVAFSPNGQVLASAGDDYQVKLWDVKTGECLQILEGHHNTVNAIAFSPTSNLLASAGQDKTIRLWVPHGDCMGILQGHQGRIWAIAFSPDGQTLISGSEDCTLKQWDVCTGACLQTYSGHAQWIKSVAFSPDGQWVASGSFDGTIKLWDVATRTCLNTLKAHQSCVTAVAFRTTDQRDANRMLASSSYDQMLKLWDATTGTCLKAWQAHSNRVWSVVFSPDGLQLASGGEDHAARLWDIRTGQSIKTWKGHTNVILSLALSSNQGELATGHEDQTIKLWHPETGEILRTLRGHTNRVLSVAFAPNGTTCYPSDILASGSADRTIKLWNGSTGDCLNTLQGHDSWVWSVAFNPTGDWLASGSYDQTIRLWQTQTGECLYVLSGHTAPVATVAFNLDGQHLATGSFDTTIKLWDIVSGCCVQTLQGHQHSVWAIAFHPNGHQLASCSYDKTIKLWDLHTGKCICTLEGHTAPVSCLAFGSKGQQIVSGSYDRTIKLWDINTGQLLRTFHGHTKPVYSILFREIPQFCKKLTYQDQDIDGLATLAVQDMIVSSSFDESLRFWDMNSRSSLASLRASRPYENMVIDDVNGLTEAQKATLYALGSLQM